MKLPVGVAAAIAVFFLARGSAAQDDEPLPIRSVTANGVAGANTFARGEWGVIGLAATNRSDEPANLRATVYFNENRTLQFAREMWVPAQSQRLSWCPVVAPEEASGITADLRTLLDDVSGGQKQRLAPPDGGVWSNLSVPLNPSAPVTAVITAHSAGHINGEVRNVVLAARAARNLRPYLSGFYSDFLSPTAEGLGGVRHLVVASDRPARDAAGRAAIRAWLRDGGKMWVMLDQVSPETVRLLLGDLISVQVVDRVGLTQIEVHRTSSSGEKFSVDGPRDYDDPVEFVRVLASGVEMLYTINDWPAAFRIAAGRGEVYFTTLGARGWFTIPAQPVRSPDGGPVYRDPVATEPLGALAADLFREPAPRLPAQQDLIPLLSEQVGYRILGRAWVMAVLGGFCLSVIGAGLWLAQRHMTEWLGWIGPAGALAAAVLLVSLGLASRRSIPPTLAVLEHVETDAGSEEITAYGAAAVYLPEPGPLAPQEIRGGIVWPDLTGMGDKIHSLVWTDLDDCHWEGLTLPAGVRFAEVRRSARLDEPMIARGEFNDRGVSGTLTSAFRSRSDGVLIGLSGENMKVQVQEDGAFHAELGHELAAGRFIAADLMSDEQRRRQSVAEQFFPRGPRSQARLAFWSEPLPGFETPQGVRFAGSVLVSVPLELERLPPGTSAVIPSPLVSYRAVTTPVQRHASAYNNSSQQWTPMQFPSDTWLRFQLPPAALPFEPSGAVLRIRIDAPGRPVEVLASSGGAAEALETWQGPHGTVRVKIDQANLLRPDQQGGLVLGIQVGFDEAPLNSSGEVATRPGKEWHIDSVALEVSGIAAEQP